MRFDFNEINILKQNLYNNKQKKADFLELLRVIIGNTDDYILKDSLYSLEKKIISLSEQELAVLRDDIVQKRLVATMNHPVASSSHQNPSTCNKVY